MAPPQRVPNFEQYLRSQVSRDPAVVKLAERFKVGGRVDGSRGCGHLLLEPFGEGGIVVAVAVEVGVKLLAGVAEFAIENVDDDAVGGSGVGHRHQRRRSAFDSAAGKVDQWPGWQFTTWYKFVTKFLKFCKTSNEFLTNFLHSLWASNKCVMVLVQFSYELLTKFL